MAELTVEEKRDALVKICAGSSNCCFCTLKSACDKIDPMNPPSYMYDRQIEELYRLAKLKGEPIMNEPKTQTTLEATIDVTIVVTRAEYAYLIAKSVKTNLLEDYVNNREYLDKDVVRAILGMYGSKESEGE